MTKITVANGLLSQFQAVSEAAQVCDPSGRVLGLFVPEIDMSEWAQVSPDVSEEELDRRAESGEWYTTAEVLAYLKSLEQQ
jgi:hypothetical protein